MALTHIVHRIIIAISHQAALVQNSHVMNEIGPPPLTISTCMCRFESCQDDPIFFPISLIKEPLYNGAISRYYIAFNWFPY